MPFLELPSNPSPIKDWPKEPTEGPTGEEAPRTPPSPRLRHNKQLHPLHAKAITKVRTGRFGELDEHELIHLLDALDDERARAQFRESVYISTILCLAIAWFLFYGPRVLVHQPYYKDTISAMKEHDQQVILNAPPIKPMPKVAPKIDRKTMDQLQKQAREARPTPQPPAARGARAAAFAGTGAYYRAAGSAAAGAGPQRAQGRAFHRGSAARRPTTQDCQ